jgi:hypothetical protein
VFGQIDFKQRHRLLIHAPSFPTNSKTWPEHLQARGGRGTSSWAVLRTRRRRTILRDRDQLAFPPLTARVETLPRRRTCISLWAGVRSQATVTVDTVLGAYTPFNSRSFIKCTRTFLLAVLVRAALCTNRGPRGYPQKVMRLGTRSSPPHPPWLPVPLSSKPRSASEFLITTTI